MRTFVWLFLAECTGRSVCSLTITEHSRYVIPVSVRVVVFIIPPSEFNTTVKYRKRANKGSLKLPLVVRSHFPVNNLFLLLLHAPNFWKVFGRGKWDTWLKDVQFGTAVLRTSQARSRNCEHRLSASSYTSVLMEQLGIPDFREIWYVNVFRKSVMQILA